MEVVRSEELTRDLEAFRLGNAGAQTRLAAMLWEELGERAARLMRQERRRRPDHSLETLALFNETWLRLKTSDALAQMLDGMGLVQVATHIMKQVLIDHARVRGAKKRVGHRKRQPFDVALERLEARNIDMTAVNDALEELAGTRSNLVSHIIWLLYIEEYEVKEVAAKLSVTVYRVEKAKNIGLAFLRGRLVGEKHDS